MKPIVLVPAVLGLIVTGAALIRDSLFQKINLSYLVHIQLDKFISKEPIDPRLTKQLTCTQGNKPLREYGAIAINFLNNKSSQWYKYDDSCSPEDLLLDNYPLNTIGYSSTAALKEFEITNLNLGGGGWKWIRYP